MLKASLSLFAALFLSGAPVAAALGVLAILLVTFVFTAPADSRDR